MLFPSSAVTLLHVFLSGCFAKGFVSVSDSHELSVYIKMQYSTGDYEEQILVHEWGLLSGILTVGRLIRDLGIVFSFSSQFSLKIVHSQNNDLIFCLGSAHLDAIALGVRCRKTTWMTHVIDLTLTLISPLPWLVSLNLHLLFQYP